MSQQVTIYHNPRCSKSRQTLQLLEEQGISPQVVLYLEDTPDQNALEKLLSQLDMSARQLLRKGEEAYKTLNLKDEALGEAELIKAMTDHPKLIERPIVVANNKARIGRPPESVLEIL
ncbi:arsenate reductase (glutaredoxin) [Spongorhabdus nitratireducens]